MQARVSRFRIMILVASLLTAVQSLSAQTNEDDASTWSREPWQSRILCGRYQADQARRQGRLLPPPDPTKQERDRLSTGRAMDQSLQVGDIVSTGRSFLQFNGLSAIDNSRVFIPVGKTIMPAQ